MEHQGRRWQDKVEDVRKELREKSASFLVVTALDEVACEWWVVCIVIVINYTVHYRAIQHAWC